MSEIAFHKLTNITQQNELSAESFMRAIFEFYLTAKILKVAEYEI